MPDCTIPNYIIPNYTIPDYIMPGYTIPDCIMPRLSPCFCKALYWNELYKIVIYIRIYKRNHPEEPEKRLKDLEGVPLKYYVYLVFKKKIINKLLIRTSFNYKIELKEGAELKYYKAYYLKS